MIGVATAIAAVMEADAYGASEVEVATELPLVWLKASNDPRLEPALERARAGATVRANLRNGAQPTVTNQRLLAFLQEMRDTKSAETLIDVSRRVQDLGEPVTGMAAGPLFCLIVGRAIVQGETSHETASSLNRFRIL